MTCGRWRTATTSTTEEQRYNVITVALAERFDEAVLHRNFFATSSCGVCGKAALEDIEVRCAPIPLAFTVPAATIVELPDRLRSAQRVFDRTGGLHAAGLFSADGELVSVREDVGRHNAIDKVIGEQLLGRRSFRSRSGSCRCQDGSRSRSCRRRP